MMIPRNSYISAVVTLGAWLIARFGFDVPQEVRDAIVIVGSFVIALFIKPPGSKDCLKSKDEPVDEHKSALDKITGG